MKAVIVDLQGLYAAALCEDGSIRKIEAGSCVIGQTVDLQELSADVPKEKKSIAYMFAGKAPVSTKAITNRYSEHISATDRFVEVGKPITAAGGSETIRAAGPRHRSRHRIISRLAIAAAACFLTVSMGVVTVWAMPYGSVCLEEDTGASVTYTINRFDYVLDVTVDDENAAADAAVRNLDEKKIRHCRIERAVSETLDQLYAGRPGEDESADTAIDTGSLITGSNDNGSLDPESTEAAVEISHGLAVRADLPDRKHAAKVCARLEQVGVDQKAMLKKEQSSQENNGSLPGSSREKEDGSLPDSSQEKENGSLPESSPAMKNEILPESSQSMDNKTKSELSTTKKEGLPSESLPANENVTQPEPSPAKENVTLADPSAGGNNTKRQSRPSDPNAGSPDQKENGGNPDQKRKNGSPGQNDSGGYTGSRDAGSSPGDHPEGAGNSNPAGPGF